MPEPVAEAEPAEELVAEEPEVEPEPNPEPEADAEAEPSAEHSRRGFFASLFRRD